MTSLVYLLLPLVVLTLALSHGQTTSITLNELTTNSSLHLTLSPNTSHPLQVPRQYTFRHYQFVLQWPVSLCNTALKLCPNVSKSTLPRLFLTHGLWPYPSPQNPLLYGKKFQYNDSDFQKLIPRLEIEWPNVKTYKLGTSAQGNSGFWKHEWDSHGRLSNLNQADYFDLALTVKSKFNTLVQDLDKANFKLGSSVDPANMNATIGTWYPKYNKQEPEPIMYCNVGSNKKEQIWELRFGITTTNHHLFKLNIKDQCTMNKKVEFPG